MTASSALFFIGCGGAGERVGSALQVEVYGSATAWQGIQKLEVESKELELPRLVGAAQSGSFSAQAFVCTRDRERFLNGPTVAIRVTKNSGEVVESTIERVACRYAEGPGDLERLHVGLSESGRILSDFAEDSNGPWTACDPPGTKWLCPVDEY